MLQSTRVNSFIFFSHVFLSLLIGTHIAQGILELVMYWKMTLDFCELLFLSLPLKYWDCRHEPLSLAYY